MLSVSDNSFAHFQSTYPEHWLHCVFGCPAMKGLHHEILKCLALWAKNRIRLKGGQ